jgi:hypothetical protein
MASEAVDNLSDYDDGDGGCDNSANSSCLLCVVPVIAKVPPAAGNIVKVFVLRYVPPANVGDLVMVLVEAYSVGGGTTVRMKATLDAGKCYIWPFSLSSFHQLYLQCIRERHANALQRRKALSRSRNQRRDVSSNAVTYANHDMEYHPLGFNRNYNVVCN